METRSTIPETTWLSTWWTNTCWYRLGHCFAVKIHSQATWMRCQREWYFMEHWQKKSLIFQAVATHNMKQKREPWCSKKQLSKSDIARKNAPIDCLLAAHSLPRVQQVSEWEKRQDRNPNNHRKNQGTIYTAAPVTHTHVSVTLKKPRRTSRAWAFEDHLDFDLLLVLNFDHCKQRKKKCCDLLSRVVGRQSNFGSNKTYLLMQGAKCCTNTCKQQTAEHNSRPECVCFWWRFCIRSNSCAGTSVCDQKPVAQQTRDLQ